MPERFPGRDCSYGAGPANRPELSRSGYRRHAPPSGLYSHVGSAYQRKGVGWVLKAPIPLILAAQFLTRQYLGSRAAPVTRSSRAQHASIVQQASECAPYKRYLRGTFASFIYVRRIGLGRAEFSLVEPPKAWDRRCRTLRQAQGATPPYLLGFRGLAVNAVEREQLVFNCTAVALCGRVTVHTTRDRVLLFW